MLKLYNTLTRKIEEVPKKDHINLYTCGPTVYNYAHIGNLRSYIMADLLYRTLKYDGYKPKWVMNITDIDDKTIKGAIAKFGSKATVENLREFTKFYLDEFLKDLGEVNVLKDEITFIRVTDVIKETLDFIVELINKGYAYKADDGSTYFSIEKYQKDFGDYGVLVGEKFIEGKKVGARVAVDEYEKDNLSDFALWKAWDEASDAQIFWDHSILGKGRPGWHIECSVINKIGFNGEPTDIHTGGVDLIFPHHTNEIAQSQALFGKGNFVHHWFHSEHLLVDGKKMAKSAKNFYTLKDLNNKYPIAGKLLRHQFLSAKYSSQQDFTDKSIRSSLSELESFKWYIRDVLGLDILNQQHSDQVQIDLGSSLDDLNYPSVLANINKIIHEAAVSWNSKLDSILDAFDKIGIPIKDYIKQEEIIPKQILEYISIREDARNNKDFTKSDELRKQIEDLGYEVMDTSEGQKVKKKLQI
jgi:cysteinyl-tRNA synthetase